jgi:tetratricopeptide (TPR) repeat protein
MIPGGLVFPTLLALFIAAVPSSERTVPIVFAADNTVRSEPLWRGNIEKLVREANRYYGSRFALTFETSAIENWQPRGSSLEAFLDELRATIGAIPGKIVVGLTNRRPASQRFYGLTSYQDAVVVISLPEDTSSREHLFLHEIAHVFGAIHLTGISGLMSIEDPSDALEPLNAKLIELNRDRRFAPHLFPLAPESFDEATELYRTALPMAEGEAPLLLAEMAIETGDYAEALSNAEKLLVMDPERAEAYNLKGIALRRMGRPADAVPAYEEAIERRPGNAQIHYNLAIALEKLNETEAAAASYERALDLQHGHLKALSNLAALLAHEG